MNACACMGPQGSDPVCPCRMKNGDIPGQQWVRFPELERALSPVADWVAAIRRAGGIVHGDGNIFFTNVEQFKRAAVHHDRLARRQANRVHVRRRFPAPSRRGRAAHQDLRQRRGLESGANLLAAVRNRRGRDQREIVGCRTGLRGCRCCTCEVAGRLAGQRIVGSFARCAGNA